MSNRRPGRVVQLEPRGTDEADGRPPVRRSVRNPKPAGSPAVRVGRQGAGGGKRLFGQQAGMAQHLFEVLGELKGCAQKLSQMLAVYQTALPPRMAAPYREALSRLQNSGLVMLPTLVHQAMATSMGTDWRENFRDFDDHRAAAASIGQVHRAIWQDGTPVAVKVMYPGAREAVLSELAQLKLVAPIAAAAFPGAAIRPLADTFHDCVSEELDYRQEADYQRAFAAAYASDSHFLVPKVIEQQGDVLISEWVDAVPATRLVSSDDQRERNRIGLLILRFVMTSFGRTGYLYGDPHPSNFRLLADGRLGVVDFGACSAVPPPGLPPSDFSRLICDVGDAVFNGGNDELRAAFRMHGFVSSEQELNVEALAVNLAPIRDLFATPEVRMNGSWLRRRIENFTDPRLSNVTRQLTLPSDLTPIARTIVATAGVLCQLECEGPLREEVLRTVPELADVIRRFEQRTR